MSQQNAEALKAAFAAADAGDADLVIPEAGSFAVRGGREIIVDALPEVPDRNLRLFLLGSAMGLLLHQRGLLPLHANAVSLGGRTIAVAGSKRCTSSSVAPDNSDCPSTTLRP